MSTARIEISCEVSDLKFSIFIIALMHLSDIMKHLKLSESERLAKNIAICSEMYGLLES